MAVEDLSELLLGRMHREHVRKPRAELRDRQPHGLQQLGPAGIQVEVGRQRPPARFAGRVLKPRLQSLEHRPARIPPALATRALRGSEPIGIGQTTRKGVAESIFRHAEPLASTLLQAPEVRVIAKQGEGLVPVFGDSQPADYLRRRIRIQDRVGQTGPGRTRACWPAHR